MELKITWEISKVPQKPNVVCFREEVWAFQICADRCLSADFLQTADPAHQQSLCCMHGKQVLSHPDSTNKPFQDSQNFGRETRGRASF